MTIATSNREIVLEALLPLQAVQRPAGPGQWEIEADAPQATLDDLVAAAPDATEVRATASANRTTIEQQATTALESNTTYLGITSPTNAQVVAQVDKLTRQNNKIIRLILNQLDGTD